MPIYEYRCKQGHQFEVMQRMTDEAVSSCQTCSAPVQRVFHPIAVHFKGKGFYNTDYGTRKRSRELKDAAEGGSKSDGEGGSKSNGDGGSKSDGDGAAATKDSKPSSDGDSGSAKPAKADSRSKSAASSGAGAAHSD